MPLQFTVLASGSAGNASLLEMDGFGVLIDAGLGPRQLSQPLAAGAERAMNGWAAKSNPALKIARAAFMA